MTAKQSFTLSRPSTQIGCDPELFLTDDKGRVVGSERVLNGGWQDDNRLVKVVEDGVQVELNPYQSTCRALVARSISRTFCELKKLMDTSAEKGLKVKASFKPVVLVHKKELESLSEDARTLGCQPSLSAYGTPPIMIDGMVYRKRSAAGHIHIGTNYIGSITQAEKLVKLLDRVVGIPSVLIDRDPGNRERRKHYGRAGEYRRPSYGVEYRTPSNFWLLGYPLFSLVAALCRTSVGLIYSQPSVVTSLLSEMSDEDVQAAINDNDLDLATKLWDEQLKPLLFERLTNKEGINLTNLEDFEFFRSIPLKKWFPEDPLEHWINLGNGHGVGWEAFCTNVVRPKRQGLANVPLRDHETHFVSEI